ncbi:protein of unknown function [Xenorhabdus nematophila AN6/1]|nr:protein of unknown function [Xenorhabdus nematophila AN6/1]
MLKNILIGENKHDLHKYYFNVNLCGFYYYLRLFTKLNT